MTYIPPTHTHTHTRSWHLLWVAAVTASLLSLAGSLHAQTTPRYRVTPLVELGFEPSPDDRGAIGMNNKGQVVFSYMAGEPNGTQVEHAWLWLPETD